MAAGLGLMLLRYMATVLLTSGGRQVSLDTTTCHGWLGSRHNSKLFVGCFVLGSFCSSAGHGRFHGFG